MHTLPVVIGLIAGLALLIKGADTFVDASIGIARRFRVSPVIIGLTIVSMGTSIPELVISVTAAINGANDLAVANVVGANIFNLMMILGLAAMVRPISVRFYELTAEFWLSVGAAVFLLLIYFILGDVIPRPASFVLFAVYAGYIIFLVKQSPKTSKDDPSPSETSIESKSVKPLSRLIFMALLASALIFAGGQLTVWAAENLGPILGLSERVVGLTIVSIATSLPELTFTLIACKRGENEMAVGTIIGSNIFNIMTVLGLSGVILPLTVGLGTVTDLFVLVAGSLLFLLFVTTRNKIARWEGAVMAVIYVGYIIYLLVFPVM
ncbi:MAG: calcium/sodium antiporter [Defluviitaleaceae bacterium]|nr:calcium/sodium antiporter [Defluviitaleaceae bacterium]